MDGNILKDYLQITKGHQMPEYYSPEEQGKRIKRCSILEEANFSYSNHTEMFKQRDEIKPH